MVGDSSRPSNADIEARISKVGRYSRYAKAGLGVIVGAFLLALVGLLPSSMESVPSAVNAMLLPTIFVGMGLILFSIATHLHIMHLNLVHKLQEGD